MRDRGMLRRRGLWGLALGIALAVADNALFVSLGVDVRPAGPAATLVVLLFSFLTFGALGYTIGRLSEERARAQADALTIREQLRQLETSQQIVLQAEKLAALGRLAAGIAHEVRNPLGVIKASASLLQDSFAAGDDRNRACTFIREEIDRLNGVITSLLTFAQPRAIDLQRIELGRVIDQVLQLAAGEVTRRGIVVERVTGVTPDVQADPGLMAQAVLGLVINATEALDGGGRIVVRVAREPSAVCVEVADDGPGVPSTDAERVFEPFFTSKPHGTGLGLAMSARIVQAHAGRLELMSGRGAGEGGRGACFRITLPASDCT